MRRDSKRRTIGSALRLVGILLLVFAAFGFGKPGWILLRWNTVQAKVAESGVTYRDVIRGGKRQSFVDFQVKLQYKVGGAPYEVSRTFPIDPVSAKVETAKRDYGTNSTRLIRVDPDDANNIAMEDDWSFGFDSLPVPWLFAGGAGAMLIASVAMMRL